MIEKIYLYNENGELRVVRTYKETLSNDEIRILVKEHENYGGSFFDKEELKIVFKKYFKTYVVFVTRNENEMYILGVISTLMDSLNLHFKNMSELTLIYDFHRVYDLIDNCILGGYCIRSCKEKILKIE